MLNCFSYTGAFSVAACMGGALSTTSVDISKEAIDKTKQNFLLNKCPLDEHLFFAEDVFKFLRSSSHDFSKYSLVVMDPPAFAKKRKDIVSGCRGYKDINRLIMEKMRPGGLLLTSSCSYYVDPSLFQKVVFQASVEAKRRVRIIDRHHQARDHPVNICHPEGDYLKSLLLHVE